MALGMLRDHARGAAGDDLAAAVATLGSEIDDPIRCQHQIDIVLDDHQRVAGVDQATKGTK